MKWISTMTVCTGCVGTCDVRGLCKVGGGCVKWVSTKTACTCCVNNYDVRELCEVDFP